MGTFYKIKANEGGSIKYLSVDSKGHFYLKETADTKYEVFEIIGFGWNPFNRYYAIKTHPDVGGKYFSFKTYNVHHPILGDYPTLSDKLGDKEYWSWGTQSKLSYFNAKDLKPLVTLSHAHGKVAFQNGVRGTGELWDLVKV